MRFHQEMNRSFHTSAARNCFNASQCPTEHKPVCIFPETNEALTTFKLGVHHIEELEGDISMVEFLQQRLVGLPIVQLHSHFAKVEYERILKTAVCLAIVKRNVNPSLY